ncbi:hypothetical protein PAMC26510_08230 [Caballeronia sordidicola]|uniref:Uncharacterized protein n=1 Tax=Caballeronia sordidicola TaxID=196367 RepID=A0A242N1V0_CABSO|nr:hypothetical protein PAMC26510_08230 [Caballeronia sordidicola]
MLGAVLQRHFGCQTVDAAIAFRIDIHLRLSVLRSLALPLVA